MLLQNNNRTITAPDFLIVGAAKAGTTSLHFYLKKHAEVFMPSEQKESYFFTYMNQDPVFKGDCQDQIISNPNEYFSWFSNVNDEKVIGECSNTYLYEYEKTIANIKAVYGDRSEELKIIILLRNPIERAFSMYQMLKNRGVEKLSFSEAIKKDTIQRRAKNHFSPAYDYIGWGMYYNQIKAYMQAFPSVQILFTEDLNRAPHETMHAIHRFIGVNVDQSIDLNIKYNVTGIYKSRLIKQILQSSVLMSFKAKLKSNMDEQAFSRMKYFAKKRLIKRDKLSGEDRSRLVKIYADEIKKIEYLTGRNLSEWIGSNAEKNKV